MSEERIDWIDEAINYAQSIHILGARLNPERPAHRAIHDLADRGWRLVPVHPRDAGNNIREELSELKSRKRIIPQIVVLFLAPARAQAAIMNMIMKYQYDDMPLIWLQRGAESDEVIEMLEEMISSMSSKIVLSNILLVMTCIGIPLLRIIRGSGRLVMRMAVVAQFGRPLSHYKMVVCSARSWNGSVT